MTSAGGAEAAPRAEGGKSLKDQNRWQLWLIVAVNALFLYGVVLADAIKADGLRSIFTEAQNLLPVGLALVVATVLNGLFSADMNHALPGHRAFSEYAARDPRVDLVALEKLHCGSLPIDPMEQNRAWYRLYKTVENDHAVRQVHRDFLLLRDYAGLCALFVLFFGGAGLYAIPSFRTAWIYVLVLIVQFLIVRQAAANYGVRLVTTVLARRAARADQMPVGKRTRKPNTKPSGRS